MFVSKTSSRHVFKTSSRRLQRNNFSFSKTFSRRLARCLKGVFKTSWKTKNCYAEGVLKTSSRHVLKTSSRRLEDVLEDKKLLSWRRVKDVFKTCLENVFKTSSRPTNVCWVATQKAEFWKQKYMWLFHYFNFERKYDVLKSKSPCLFGT